MKYRNLGHSPIELSAVGLGCMTMTGLYGQADENECIATIHAAIDNGVTFLDTSDAYGAGKNEELVGRAIVDRRDKVVLASKFGNVTKDGKPGGEGRPEYVVEACDKSLQRLGVDTIDVYFQHRVDTDVPIEDTVGAMARLELSTPPGTASFPGLPRSRARRWTAAVSAILVVQYGVSFWLTLPIAGLFCAGASVLIGLPILRLRGVYFAMVTLVLTEVAKLLALALPITNGAKGMVSIPLPGALKLFGITLIPDFATLENVKPAFYYLSVILMLLCFAGLYRLVHSRIGRLCQSLQQNEELASSIGVNIAYLRIIAYSISSCLGGIGGAIFMAISQSIYPSSFTVADSINFMLNCFLGGLGYVFGPMLGTLVLYFGWDLLFLTGKFQLLIFSSVLIFLILVLPNGLLSLRLYRRKQKLVQ